MDVLNANIDLKGYEPGEYTVPVIMSEDSNNYTLVGDVTVNVVITGDTEGTSADENETTARRH